MLILESIENWAKIVRVVNSPLIAENLIHDTLPAPIAW